MLGHNDGESDQFFDSAEQFSFPEESDVAKDEVELSPSEFRYDIWLNEPQSVKERRDTFLRGMGFAEFSFPVVSSDESEIDVDRLSVCSGAVSSSLLSGTDSTEQDFACSRNGQEDDGDYMVDEFDEQEHKSADVGADGFSHSPVKCKQTSLESKARMNWWWKFFGNKRNNKHNMSISESFKPDPEVPRLRKLNTRHYKKRWMELSALYVGQEIQAHDGIIWTMKFSPDGEFLATGGSDGMVRIWRVASGDASHSYVDTCEGDNCSLVKKDMSGSKGIKSNHASVLMPDQIFWISESPLHEFRGHTSDVLQVAWSSSNKLLSSSKDNTVRLWKVGCDRCLDVFRHSNYVTCIQFNPLDENYFISGSIDGKARIWGISERRVVDWADARDVITAICYQPDGKGIVVGSITGTCRFFEMSGNHLQQDVVIHGQGKKRTFGNKITSIQFSRENSRRVMISSEDCRLRILEGTDIISKYRGHPRSVKQMSASFTSSGNHMVSTGEDRVYLWNYDDFGVPPSKSTKSMRSCEYFSSEGVSIAVPWSGTHRGLKDLGNHKCRCSFCVPNHREPEQFSLGNCFSLDRSCMGSATWPEERLPLCEVPLTEEYCESGKHQGDLSLSEAWGLVIVTGSYDGKLRAFHNYGLPVRL
ncbi:uncharacterized protein LOC115682021 isoform X1 [Syzygium oleosum]|uniref:uncharacterized protein LOC115682021 isoform X1 n=1 Tax=Syzygium oleosum TaxID=219896 RepID=UPI0011D27775|nr:uncharacterized protein LOC115682021 isoform X1 [Syzygium oleosum]